MFKPIKESNNGCLRVLICDDNLILQKYMKNILKKRGFSVLGVPDGKSFLAKINTFEPQVILLDINLPDTTGIILHEKLRQWDNYRKTPVIFVSSYSVPEKPYCYSLQKPFDSNQLFQKVLSVCNGTKKAS